MSAGLSLSYVVGPYGLHEGFGKRLRGPDFAEGLDGVMGVEGERTHAHYCMAGCADTLTVEESRGFEIAVGRFLSPSAHLISLA